MGGGGNSAPRGSNSSDFSGGEFSGSCEEYSATTNICSPNSDALSSINIGAELTIDIQKTDNREIVVVINDDVIVGSLLPHSIGKLKDCIRKGNRYSAKVLKKEGAMCNVSIYWVGKN